MARKEAYDRKDEDLLIPSRTLRREYRRSCWSIMASNTALLISSPPGAPVGEASRTMVVRLVVIVMVTRRI